jgi:hypothetical protein
MSRTIISDEDGVYDPAHFNDRLLLGLKGTMSEAELHILPDGHPNSSTCGHLKFLHPERGLTMG